MPAALFLLSAILFACQDSVLAGGGTNTYKKSPSPKRSPAASPAPSPVPSPPPVRPGGDIYLWGINQYGQLGDGMTLDKPAPSLVTIPGQTVNFLALGRYHSAALTTTSNIYTWGANDLGQLGDGTFVTKYTPTPVTVSGQYFKALAAGGYTTGALTTGGELYMWGWSGNGEVGDGYRFNRPSPTKISVTVKVVVGTKTNTVSVLFQSIALGFHHSGALSTGGQLYLWGSSMYGQLGGGNTIGKTVPTLVSVAGKLVQTFSLGMYHTAAIATDGSLYTWGLNAFGQLGDGTTLNRFSPTPVVAPGKVFRAVSLGTEHSGALTTANELLTWGNNSFGQLGDNTTTMRKVPTPAFGPTFSSISFGNSHSGGLGTDNLMYLWGQNWFGQVGIPSGPNSIFTVPVVVPIMGQKPVQVALGGWHSGAVAVSAPLSQALNGRRQEDEFELEGAALIEAQSPVLLWVALASIVSVMTALAIIFAKKNNHQHTPELVECLAVEMEMTVPVACSVSSP